MRNWIYREKPCATWVADRDFTPGETWQIYNWFQHFTPESIESELQDSGFEIDQMNGDLSGAPLEADSELLGIIARRT